MKMKPILICSVLAVLAAQLNAQTTQPVKINADFLLKQDDAYLKSPVGKEYLDNVLSFQNADGGFPKNVLSDQPRAATEPTGADRVPRYGEWGGISTIDNNATYTEIRLMARAFELNGNEAYKAASIKGIEFLIANQYSNGGWAQRFPPPRDSYHKHITYNDNAMPGVMFLMKDVAAGNQYFAFTSSELRAKAKTAFDKGLDCILKSQIEVNGKLTAWCQQHDYQTLKPVAARRFEPACICSGESVTILHLLMSVENPSPEVKRSIEAGVAWLDEVKITGKKLEKFTNADGKPDLRLIDDPTAPPIWSRMYDIPTNKPIFGTGDEKIHFDFSDLTPGGRLGYAWYRPFAAKVPAEYAAWKKKNPS